MKSNLQDKIKGIIFGQAIGDALGLATEFMTLTEVKENYPNGLETYSDIIQDNHRSRWEIGDWTDDTDQFLCIIDSILEKRAIDEKHIAQKIL